MQLYGLYIQLLVLTEFKITILCKFNLSGVKGKGRLVDRSIVVLDGHGMARDCVKIRNRCGTLCECRQESKI